jgi:catalase
MDDDDPGWLAVDSGESEADPKQVMTPEEAVSAAFDPFDVTKIWPRSELF